MKKGGLKAGGIFLIFLLFTSSNPPRDNIFPDELWIVCNPEKQRVDSKKLHQALDYLKRFCGKDGLDETVITRNGYLIYQGAKVYRQHNIYSCTKAFTSTALGLLIDELKCNIEDFAADKEPLLADYYDSIQLKHFITMTSGYSAIGASQYCDGCVQDDSATPFKPDFPLFMPGSYFCYWDEAQVMLARVLTQISKRDLKRYLDEKIMRRIGIHYWDWISEGDLSGVPIRNGSTGVKLNALQLARFGHLFLNNGKWRGEQLISSKWISEATKPQVPDSLPVANTDRDYIKGNGRYGYNWWVRGDLGDMPDTPEGTYYILGSNNNVCFVIPEWNMVFVRMGRDGSPLGDERHIYNQFFKELGNAIGQ